VWSVFAVPEGGQRHIWPAGPVVTHDRLAATLARLMGLDYRIEQPGSAPAIESVLAL
jgi:hypothetical protein